MIASNEVPNIVPSELDNLYQQLKQLDKIAHHATLQMCEAIGERIDLEKEQGIPPGVGKLLEMLESPGEDPKQACQLALQQ
jgi:hypothetical protein